jgi:3-oxoacyl-[acyl-carrier protein] reductase
MSGELDGRSALVTGAGAGIGRAITLALAGAGASLSVVDIDLAAARAVADEVSSLGGQALALQCDVSDPRQTSRAVQAAAKAFGGLHILVNNAGICPQRAFEEITPEEWNRVLAVNLAGPFHFCQAALPYLRQAGAKGRVINIASLSGQIGGIAVGAHYTASKGGVLALSRQLAKLLAPSRATVNCISPGTTDTDLTRAWEEDTRQSLIRQIPLGRLGEPQDVAGLALFLATDAAAYITGATFNVNGGLYM